MRPRWSAITSPSHFDVLVWKDGGNTPVVLGFGVTLESRRILIDLMTVTRTMRRGPKRVELIGEDGEEASVLIDWQEPLNPALYGEADFRLL